MKNALKLMVVLATLVAGASPMFAADNLVKQGQLVEFHFTQGPFRTGGKNHDGRLQQTLRGNTFGPSKVISHDEDALTFKGAKTTCTMRKNHTVTCESGSAGTWN